MRRGEGELVEVLGRKQAGKRVRARRTAYTSRARFLAVSFDRISRSGDHLFQNWLDSTHTQGSDHRNPEIIRSRVYARKTDGARETDRHTYSYATDL